MLSRLKDENDSKNNLYGGLSSQNMEYSLFEATLASFRSQSILPILKEELKLKIQTNRMAAGKEELPMPVFKEPEKFELTAEEKRKRQIRKESNRIAAAKCRKKRKSTHEHLKTTLAEMELKNYTLKRKLEDLEQEKERVIKSLKASGTFTNIFLPPQQPSPLCCTSSCEPYSTENTFYNDSSVPARSDIPKHSDETNHVQNSSDHNEFTAKIECQPGSYEDLPREMEYMNWIAPRFPDPRPCSSTCTMDESWQDDLFDEVDGELLYFESLNDKSKDDSMAAVNEAIHAPRHFLPLFPTFEDDATVPGNEEDIPTTPTFY